MNVRQPTSDVFLDFHICRWLTGGRRFAAPREAPHTLIRVLMATPLLASVPQQRGYLMLRTKLHYERQAWFSYPHLCDLGQRSRAADRCLKCSKKTQACWIGAGGKNGRHNRRSAGCICSHNGRYPTHTPGGIERIFSHRGGRPSNPCGLRFEYVGKIIPKGETGSEAQSHRFMVKNTKAMMNAARMRMVPMPMGANLAEIHPGATRGRRAS
jgi:hypothetical protein